MKNAIEKAAIAKTVANYIIDHLLYEGQPMSASELNAVARDVAQDKISQPVEIEEVTKIAINYVSTDPRVFVKSDSKKELWLYHNGK